MTGFDFDDARWVSPPWRGAGRCGVDSLALLMPLEATGGAAVWPGIRRCEMRAGGAEPSALAALAASEPLEALPRAELNTHALALWPEFGCMLGDRLQLVESELEGVAWRFTFRLTRLEDGAGEPVPARLCLLVAVALGDAEPQRLTFRFVASQQSQAGVETALDIAAPELTLALT